MTPRLGNVKPSTMVAVRAMKTTLPGVHTVLENVSSFTIPSIVTDANYILIVI